MNALKGKTVLIGVTGGIAAYKTCSVVSALVKLGATCHVMMTKNATNFVAPLSFETLSHNRVTVDTFDRDFTWEVEHVSLSKKADAVLIAPATANVIAKLAAGICDDFLTTTVLACTCPIIIAPAMNTAMLENPVTWMNIDTLVSRGMMAVFGGEGRLACGDTGAGRMAEPDDLVEELNKLFSKKCDLTGKTVLVTSGATMAPIDPVRFLTNRSSGKMGYSIALAAHERGANIIYIKGITNDFNIPQEWEVHSVTTTAELYSAVKDSYEKADIIVAAAAPCDYEIEPVGSKIKSETFSLTLKKTTDIAAFVGKNKGKRKLVVFAAETDDCEKNALSKLKKKNADLVVLNDVTKEGAGFDTDTNIATLITEKSAEPLPIMSKRDLADRILDKTLEL